MKKNNEELYDFAFNIFRNFILKNEQVLTKLSKDLNKAKIMISPEKYFALALFLGLIAIPISIIIALIFSAISGFSIINILLSFIIGIGIGVGTLMFILYYPKTIIDSRKKRIENAISFAALYLTTMSESSILPKDMFKLLGNLEEYGEIAIEARKIAEDMEGLGMDLSSSIESAIARSPSQEWSEFLSGFRTTIVSGGDLKEYLLEKTKGYTSEYKRKLGEFGKMLGMLLQMYLTVVGVGTVFFIVMSSLMGVIGGMSPVMIKTMQYFLVVIGIPLVTVGMIIIIRAISPLSVK